MSARTVRRVQGHQAASAGFECRMFGPFELKGQHELHIKIKKVKAIIAYLLLEGPTSRSKLARLLWSESEESARRNLRRELHDMRKSDLEQALKSQGETLSLEGNWTSDVAEFNQAFEAAHHARVVELYRGVFLENLDLPDASEFNEWLEHRRDDFVKKYAQGLSQLAEETVNQGQHRQALDLYTKLLVQDPFQERTYRQMMRLHALLGEREQALECYAVCCEVLRRELGVEPLPDTTELAQQIRTGVNPTAKPEAPPVSLGRFNTPLVGREAALAELRASQAVLTLVLGEAGVGKTRLVQEYCARQPSLWLRFPEDSSQTPLYAVAQSIRERTQTTGLNLADLWRKEVGRLVPELRVKSLADSPSFTGPEERLHFLEGLTQALLALSGNGVLVLDDLHWADHTSLGLLAHLMQRLKQKPSTRLIVTSRPQELSANTAAELWLSGLEREGRAKRLVLGALHQSDVHQLIQKMSGSAEGQLFAKRLYQATQGNPYFLLETLRYLFDTQEISLEAGIGWSTRYDQTTESYDELPIPPSVKHAVLERARRLGGASQRLLEAASLTCDGFKVDELIPATALSDWEGLDAIEAAVAARLLQFSDSGYRFQHDLARRAISESISPERKRLIHAKLAHSLIERQGNPARIAHHLEQSAQKAQAVQWRVKAAQAAQKIYAHHEALEHYGRALGGTSDPECFAIHRARANLYGLLDQRTEQAAELLHMQDLAGLLGAVAVAETLLLQADLAVFEGNFAGALERAAQVLAQTDLLPSLHTDARRISGFALQRQGRLKEAQTYLQKALEQPHALTPGQSIQIQTELGNIALQGRDFSTSQTHFTAALNLALDTQDALSEVTCRSHLARLAGKRGDHQGAIEQFQPALQQARTYGFSRYEGSILRNLAAAHSEVGEAEQALAYLEQGLELARQPRDPYVEGLILNNMAAIHCHQGNYGLALKGFWAALEAARSAGLVQNQLHRQTTLADLLLNLGDLAGARPLLEEALEQMDRSGVRADELWVRTNLARLDWLEGRAEAALVALEALMPKANGSTDELYCRWVLGQVRLALGDAKGALEAIQLEVPEMHRSDFLSVRLECELSLKQVVSLEAAKAHLKQGKSYPLDRLRLYLSVVKVQEALGKTKSGLFQRQQATVLAIKLAESLTDYPHIKTSFSHQYRDLLK